MNEQLAWTGGDSGAKPRLLGQWVGCSAQGSGYSTAGRGGGARPVCQAAWGSRGGQATLAGVGLADVGQGQDLGEGLVGDDSLARDLAWALRGAPPPPLVGEGTV